MIKYAFWVIAFAPAASNGFAQELYVPGGTTGIGSSQNGYVGVKAIAPLDVFQVNTERPILMGSNGGNGVYGSHLGFNMQINTTNVPNTVTKLGGTLQRGGAIVTVDYLGNYQLQTYNAGTDSASTINYDPQFTFSSEGKFGVGTGSPDATIHVRGAMALTSSPDFNHYYNVLSYSPGGGEHAGTLKITLPKGPSSTMMQVTIRGYDYTTRGAWQLNVGGYNYGGDGLWYNYSAQIIGRAPFKQVRLGYDGVKNVILLGDTTTVWSYAQIEVSDFISTFSGTSGWATGWTAALLGAESGLTNVVFPTIDTYTNAYGNVGIGTTNPTHKLSVNGAVRAKEVIVDTGWSDYVFAPDYTLTPLSEVEAHIKQHQHLPGIPSAANVAENGVSVGEMQAKLLAKIEELTLHQIQQEKEMSRQREFVNALSIENATLKTRVHALENRTVSP